MEQEWEPPGLLTSIWRYRYMVAAVALAAVFATYWLSAQQDTTYEATASAVLINPGTNQLLGTSPQLVDPMEYVPRRSQQMTSRPVLERASALLDEQITVDALERRVSAVADVEVETVNVTGSGSSPESAAAVANAVVTAYESLVRERAQADAEAAIAELEGVRDDLQQQIGELQSQLDQDPQSPGEENPIVASRLEALNAQLLDLQARAQEVAITATVNGSGVDYVEVARVPETPSSPKPVRNAAIALVLGGGLASAFAFRRANRNQRIESRSAPERILGAPLLGEIPVYAASRSGGLAQRLALPVAAAEAYEFVLSSMEYALDAVNGSSIVITSAAPEDGKTSTAVQLAVAATRNGQDVVLVDADLRARGLSRLLEIDKRPGLTEVASGRTSLERVAQRFRVSDDAHLPVVPAGMAGHEGVFLLRSPGVSRLFAEIDESTRMVIVDSPPLLAATDASVMASYLDGIVLVVNAGTSVDHLRRVRERLDFTGTPLLGYVYNRSSTAVVSYYDYGLEKRSQRRPRILGKSTTAAGPEHRPLAATSGRTPESRSVNARRAP